MGKFISGIFLLLLVASSAKADGSCKKGCPESDNGILKYIPGKVYDYGFDSILTVGLSAGAVSEADDTSLKVVGNAKVYAEGNCGYTLQLTAVQVSNTKESIEKKIQHSIQKPVHFTIVNDKVLPEVCADPTDSVYSLNIKRAVISLLQSNTDAENQEVDVFGQCSTHTSSSKVGNAEVITKVRNLNGCAYREQINSGLVSGVVNEKAGVKSTMLFQADYLKEAKLEHDVVDNVQLVESYKFTGTAKGNSDVHAKVVTSLKLKNQAGSAAAAPSIGNNARSVSIIFQKPETYASKNIAVLKTTLSHLVDLTSDYVKKDSAKQFVELIRLMRNSDTDTLLELGAAPHPNKVLARKVYLDALFRTNTAESAKAILKQLNKFDEKEKTLAILSLNLVENVDKDTLNQAAALLTPNSAKEIYLSVGHLVSKYCNKNACTDADIEQISKKFTDNLKHCKANTKKDEERIVYVLKGIGNTEHLAKSVEASLAECSSVAHANRIRVAALQAFGAVRCSAALQRKSLDLLKDQNEDSELRIEAYLAAVSCPNAELANELADIVNSEKVLQVGGFITSHLKAIRDSTDATRENQRHFLGNVRVTKHFPKDFRRYSFNNEVSYKLEALGLSASSDYKLIYSQHGFLPRSARLNFTTEVFGTNFNVFEASIRQENLENVLEYYVGPKGLLNKDFDDIVKQIELGNGSGGRGRRSIADDSAKIAKKYKTYGSKNSHDLNLDLSLKLFGSELTFLSLGDHIPNSLDDVIEHFSLALEKAKKELSAFNKEFVFHSLFLDTEFTYPTGVGIPLEFSAQGFAANKLDFGISVDVDAIIGQAWQQAKYRLKLVPSVDVNVNVQLGFNAHVLSTGIRVVSTAHSAGGSDINVSFLNDGNGFNVDIELPREKLELIDVKVNTELYVAEQDKALKSLALKGSKKHKSTPNENCFNQFEIVGFGVCFSSSSLLTDVTGVASQNHALTDELHLSRPFSFSLYVTTELKYNFKGSHVAHTAAGSQQWKLDFSTPGSKISHDTSLTFELGTNPRTFSRISFDNPQFHFGVEAGITNDQRELVIYGQYEQNSDIKKSKIGFTKNGNEYRPLIEIQDKNGVTNNINGYRADGKVVVNQLADNHARYNFENFQVINPSDERVVVNGWADVGPATLTTELQIAPGKQSYLLKSNFKVENNVYAVGLFVNDERAPENVYGGSAEVGVGDQNYNVKLVGKAATWALDSASHLEYTKSDVSNAITASKFSQDVNVSQKNKPVGSLKVKTLSELNKFELSAELTRDKKVASANVKFQSNQRAQHDYALEANVKFNKHFIDVLSKCDVNGNLFVVDNVLTTSWGTSVTAKGELGQRYSPQDIHIDLHGSAQFSGKEKPTNWKLKVIGTPEKTNSEFVLHRDTADLIKLTGETQHPQDKISAAKLNLVVHNVLTAKGDFKIAKNGKGELTATVETLKNGPKHKVEIDSKFHVQTPKFDLETTLIFDNDKKIYFKTENTLDKVKFSTKNVAELADKKIEFDANGSVKGEWRANGEILGSFVLTAPDGHIVSGNIKRKVTTNAKTGLVQGNMEVQLSDKEPTDGKERSVVFTGKLERLNIKTREFSVNSHLAYNGYDEKKVELSYHIKQLLKGQNKAIDFGANVQGNLIQTPIDLTLVIDEYNSEHAVGRVSAKYGNHFVANVNGNYNLGGRGIPATYELQGNVQVPQSDFKSFEVTTHGKFLKPNTEEGAAYLLDIHIDERTGNGQFVSLNSVWKGAQQQGTYNFDVQSNAMNAPFKFDGSYQREQSNSLNEDATNGKQKYSFNANYGDKFVKTTADVSYASSQTATLRYTLDSSFESAKNIELDIRAHKSAEETYQITAQAKQADKSYELSTKLYRSEHKKGLDVRATLPSGQPIVVTGILEILGERKAKLTLEIENLLDLDLKANSEASYINIDDFYIVAAWNSRKLKLDDYKFEIRAQQKSLSTQLKNAQAVVFSGTATYALKNEKNKAIIEGQGQVTIQGKTHNSNFKLTRQHFELSTDKEVGFAYTFNGNFGPKNGVSTLKLTNKEFNTKLSVCEEKKQCTNVQVQSLVSADEQQLDTVQHSLLILVDLRELGYPQEFELQSKTLRQGFKYQYNLDVNIVSNNNLKYQLVANVLPTSSKLQLKLPKREILFETKQQIPESGQLFGHYEYSSAFYIDKVSKPNDVTRVLAQVDVTGVDRLAVNAKGELKFEHHTIRPLSISGKLDANRNQRSINSELIIDIFRTTEQKVIATSHLQNTQDHNGFNITSSQQLRSTGLQFEYAFNGHTALNTDTQEFSAAAAVQSVNNDLRASTYVFGNKERVEVTVNGLDEELLHLTGDFNRQKHIAKFNTKLQIFGLKPVEIESELQPTQAKLSIKRKDLIDANAEVKIGKDFKFNVVGTGKVLFNGRVALDATNFLQTTYKSNDEDIQSFLSAVEAEIKQETEVTQSKLKQRFEKLRQRIEQQIQLAKDSAPDFTQLKGNYQNSVNDIIKELETDPSLATIIEAIRKLNDKLNKIVNDISKLTAESYEKLHKSYVELYERIQQLLKEAVLPAWEQFIETATKLIGELRVEIVQFYTKALQQVLAALEKYGPALKNYGKAINESLKPLHEVAQELFKVTAHTIEELLEEIKEYIAKLPTFEALRSEFAEKLKQLKLVEKSLEFLNTIFDQINILPQTPETSVFLEKAHEYLEAKLKQQKINDEQVLEELLKLFIKAVRSIVAAIEANSPTAAASAAAGVSSTGDFHALFSNLPQSVDFITNLPLLLSFRSSLINFLISENWQNVLTKDIVKSWLLFQDFELRGHIAAGQHIFTFDGQHFTYPGSCKYILAQDSVDNNFTVVAQLNNGKLKSIILADRDGNYIELADSGALKLNGNAAEFPQHVAGGIHAWRLVQTLHLHSEYGVTVICTTDLNVCHVHINGFYTSKTRGLLGNGNAEPYDDYLQIDGTIATDAATFANGFGLGKCNPVSNDAAQIESSTQADICNEIFGLESPLALSYLALDSRPYRQACDIAVQKAAAEKDKEAVACTIALAYGSALKFQNKFALLPPRCLKCAGAVGQRDLGEEFTVKIPSKLADVVFVVDVNVNSAVLSQLVAPAITEIRDTLKSRGFTDVQIGVVAFNESQRYPALLTSNNGKINYQGNVADVQLNGPKHVCYNCFAQVLNEKRLLEIYSVLENLIRSAAPQSDELAFNLALNYPFRAGAAKSIIGVRSDSLDYSNLWKFVRAHITGSVTRFDGALLHLLAPVKGLSLEGVPNEKLIGFNSRLVATIDGKDNKKRAKLQFENDMGIDFVLNNGGWVFATQNFDNLKPQDQKKVVNQVTSSIADTLFKTEIVSDCRCLPIQGLYAQHKCVIKSSTFVPNKKPKAA